MNLMPESEIRRIFAGMQCGRQGSCPGTCGMWHPPGYVPDTVYHAQLNARRQHNEFRVLEFRVYLK